MAYSPTMVANNILMRSFQDRIFITPMKLQKILYFVASEYAKQTGSTLLADRFQTWKYGPVLFSVYDEFRPFAKRGIMKYARDAAGDASMIDEDTDLVLQSCLDRVWAASKHRSAVYLSEITHCPGSAWYKAFQNDQDLLDEDDIREDTTYQEVLGIA